MIIPQGQLLPFEGYTTFSNAESWAISVSVDIYQGTHKHVSHDRKLKTITVNNIQPRPKGKNIFIIFMKMDKMGSLSVRVADFDTGADTVCEAIETNLSSKDIADMRRKLEDEERAAGTVHALYQPLPSDPETYCWVDHEHDPTGGKTATPADGNANAADKDGTGIASARGSDLICLLEQRSERKEGGSGGEGRFGASPKEEGWTLHFPLLRLVKHWSKRACSSGSCGAFAIASTDATRDGFFEKRFHNPATHQGRVTSVR